ncbi:hypothetical protein EDD27_7777 [Nonomuraea polychroma]|uniref:Uncharacterized protein n=1 Tax=Nonomuraea polychroma TaxID=46176 RepID=A0A438MHU2_9ACTN|nr:hypothetical protein [Nonomuraea polychroma]RVX45001.1 hypothetical protein EDD27_7777 [Nonomuraea polychroma]
MRVLTSSGPATRRRDPTDGWTVAKALEAARLADPDVRTAMG